MGIQTIPTASGLAVSDLVATPVYELISEHTTIAPVTTLTFSNIPQTYRKLYLQWAGLLENSGVTISYGIRINGDSGANRYKINRIKYRLNSSATDITEDSATSFLFSNALANQNTKSSGFLEFHNYTSTSSKIITGQLNQYEDLGQPREITLRGRYRSGSTTNPITSLSLIITSGTNFRFAGEDLDSLALYGVK